MDSYLERLQRELEDAMAGTTPASLGNGPAGKWTPAQVLEHLFLTYQNTNKGLAKCLENGIPLATRANLKHRVGTFLVVNIGYLPGGAKAPERATPRGMSAEEVQRAILPEIQQMDAGLTKCEHQFGAQAKVLDHPILGPFSVAQWRKFHWVHGRHHARQIRERLGKG
ncbi:MAG: DinB family protein [Terriglobales bacterium]